MHVQKMGNKGDRGRENKGWEAGSDDEGAELGRQGTVRWEIRRQRLLMTPGLWCTRGEKLPILRLPRRRQPSDHESWVDLGYLWRQLYLCLMCSDVLACFSGFFKYFYSANPLVRGFQQDIGKGKRWQIAVHTPDLYHRFHPDLAMTANPHPHCRPPVRH